MIAPCQATGSRTTFAVTRPTDISKEKESQWLVGLDQKWAWHLQQVIRPKDLQPQLRRSRSTAIAIDLDLSRGHIVSEN